ncbi:MAG: 3-oxoacyl-[acyl-carrier-protein] reductase [Clostridiales bacterium GWF2_38_85]|nr:MAG: 3-oxoacyl-[acyl-carrier-protein] reductase [Clostridiales bacterium GWF2_38_85]HBL85244.1 3-oxoacyl-[acyl-carrier-protein] reductase [Clostridiales bacterium]
MLKNKVAVITGASRGIGKAISFAMAEAGADVAILYNGNVVKAEEACKEAITYGVRAAAYQCNVADFNSCQNVCNLIINDFGGIDILVNNAGITKDKLLMQMSEEDFDSVIDTNLKGTFNMIRNTCKHFIKKRSGRIINISSVSGMMGNPGQANYAASKAGIIGLTKTVAKEFGARNITCNAIAPGFIETDMTGALPIEMLESAKAQIPMKRLGNSKDIASLAVFLASDMASYITGEVIKVDGGLYI